MLEVKMSVKFIVDPESKKPLYEFFVTLVKEEQDMRIIKSYSDFLQLEQHVVEVISHMPTKSRKS